MKTIRAFWLLVLLLPLGKMADARVLLKPNGRNAMPLRLKAMTARVEIEKQFATTTTAMTFGNEVAARIEADFLYEAPPRAVVTSFAYWYGDEKVVARVVEKERAREIYRSITSRMRDPALIEIAGKNIFRARIFPVMPNADLRVEISTVETLPSTPNGCEYSLPLKPEIAGKGTLENLDVTVRVAPDAMIAGVGNDLALPVARDGSGAAVMRLSQKNFRPSQDLKIGIRFRKAPLRALMLASASGGRDGFFALALTSYRDVAQPKLRFEGADVYDVLPQKLPPIKAGRELLVVGRYRGASTRNNARAILGGDLAAPVVFSSQRRDNSIATKLWAAERIETLSASTRAEARAQVVALSQRFTLPSKYTSWVAVPQAELKSDPSRKAYEDMAYFARAYAAEIIAGRAESLVARGFRKNFDAAAHLVSLDGDDALAFYFALQSRTAFGRLKAEDVKSKFSGLQRDAQRLAAVLPKSAQQKQVLDTIINARANLYVYPAYAKLSEAATDLAQAIADGKSNAPQTQRLLAEIKRLEAQTDNKGTVPGALHLRFKMTVETWAQEKYGSNPNQAKLTQLDLQVQRLAQELYRRKFTKKEVLSKRSEIEREVELRQRKERVSTVFDQIVREEEAYPPNAEKIAALRQRAEQVARENHYSFDEYMRRSVQNRDYFAIEHFALLWVKAKFVEQPDQAKIEHYRHLMEETAVIKNQGYGSANAIEDAERQVRAAEDYAYGQQAYELVNEQVKELAKPQPDAEAIEDLNRRIAVWRDRMSESSSYRYVGHDMSRANAQALEMVLANLRAEQAKDNPDSLLTAQLDARVLALQPFDSYYGNYYPHKARAEVAPEVFAKWRTERIKVRARGIKMQKRMDAASGERFRALQRERAILADREHELKVRMGDPLIAVEAPDDAMRVVAILPDGTIKNLRYESAARRWEARFDVPEYSQQGAHEIIILIVQKSGARRRLTMRFNVDVTPPHGAGSARDVSTAGAKKWRLEMRGDADTARVAALLPWNARVELEPSAQDKTLFFAVVEAPPDFKKTPRVTFVLTDRAHNRAQITVDLAP